MTAVAGDAKATGTPTLDWAMFFLALLMVPIVVIQVSATDPQVLIATEVANGVIWLIFVVELVVARRRYGTMRAFARDHWLDLLVVLLSPPLFVPSELASFRLLRLLRLVRLVAIIGRLHRGAGAATGRQGLAYVALLVLFLVFVGGVSMHEIEPERAPTVWDGFWWAVVTLTTIGYGDIAPATFEGRVLASVLMFAGLGAVATLAGSLGAMFLAKDDDDISARLGSIEEELRQLRKERR